MPQNPDRTLSTFRHAKSPPNGAFVGIAGDILPTACQEWVPSAIFPYNGTFGRHTMKRTFSLITAAGLLLLAALRIHAEDSLKSASENKPGPATPAASAPSLRKPGFIFMELGTTHVEDYFSFFESVADFKLVSREPGYLVAQSDLAELTFIDPTKFWAHGHPFSGKLTGTGQGIGIEIGIVVADIDKTYAAALPFQDKGFPISTGIVRRPWGARDFRVLATEGYYFRFTEGH